MVRGRGQGKGLLAENPNSEFMTLLMNIQCRLEDQAAMMQQQAELIQNLQQQQQGRVVDHELEGPEDEDLNMDPGILGDGGNDCGIDGTLVRLALPALRQHCVTTFNDESGLVTPIEYEYDNDH